MSHHRDSPTGKQYHVRYTPKNGDKGPYWGHIFDRQEDAVRDLRRYLDNGYADASIFVRDVSPWREGIPDR